MATQTFYDDEGREYRYNPNVDERPRRKIMGYSQKHQGGAESQRARAQMRVDQGRARSQEANQRSFGGLKEQDAKRGVSLRSTFRTPGLDEYAAMQPQRMQQPVPNKPVLPPSEVRRPGLQSPAEKMVDKVAPPSTYSTNLAQLLEQARKKSVMRK